MASNLGKGAVTAAVTTDADTLGELVGDPAPREGDTMEENEDVSFTCTFDSYFADYHHHAL